MDAQRRLLRSRMAAPVSAAALRIESASARAAAEKSGSSPRSFIARRAMALRSFRFSAEGRFISGQEYVVCPPQLIGITRFVRCGLGDLPMHKVACAKLLRFLV